MFPEATAVHKTDGRLRLRISGKKGDADFFSRIQEGLAHCPGVEKVGVNARTGSVLVIHHAALGDIGEYASQHGLFTCNNPDPSLRKSLFDSTEDVVRQLNRRLKRSTAGELDIASLVFLLLILSGAYQILRGNVRGPAWYMAFWYALGIFSTQDGRRHPRCRVGYATPDSPGAILDSGQKERGGSSMHYMVSEIEGIGEAYAAKLEKAGIKSVDDLLNLCCDTEGRRRVSEISGISHIELLKWSHMADLMRVAGIGPEYSDLLEAAGVLTVRELRSRIPAHLTETMKEVKDLKNLPRAVPSERQVAKWVENAKVMEPKVRETTTFVEKEKA